MSKEKKGNGGKAAVAVALLALLGGAGWKFGLLPFDGGTSNNTSNNSNQSEQSNTANNTIDEQIIKVEVTVEKDKYYYNNKPVELDDFVKQVKAINGSVVVFITDSDATKNAYEALTKALTDNNILYSKE